MDFSFLLFFFFFGRFFFNCISLIVGIWFDMWLCDFLSNLLLVFGCKQRDLITRICNFCGFSSLIVLSNFSNFFFLFLFIFYFYLNC